jgi:hypothetical protein
MRSLSINLAYNTNLLRRQTETSAERLIKQLVRLAGASPDPATHTIDTAQEGPPETPRSQNSIGEADLSD